MKLPGLFFSLLLCAAVWLPLHGQETSLQGSVLVETGSRIYDAIDYLSVLSGETTLLSHTPASKYEILGALDALAGRASRNFTPPDGALEASIRKAMFPPKTLLSTGSDISLATLSLEPQFSFSLSAPFSADNLLSADLLQVANDTDPAVNIPLALTFGDWLACRSEFTVGKGYWASIENDAWTNVPLTASETDMNVPTDAWVSAGSKNFTLAVGRGSVTMGRTLLGSMIFSDSFDRPDWASLAFHTSAFRLYLMPVELAPNRYVYFHGLSIRPFKNLSIDLSEAASVNAPIDLRYLNPAMIYHNYAGWRDGSAYGVSGTSPVGTQFGASVEWVPVPGVKVYGQYVMNQFQTGYELSEFSNTASYIPNSLGGLIGSEWIYPAGQGFLVVTAEGLYANPWLYILENGDISYIWARRELVAPSGKTSEWIYGWTGNPFGPDTLSALINVAYDIPFSHRIGFSYRVVAQGSNGESSLEYLRSNSNPDWVDWYPDTLSEATITTPSGTTAIQHAVRVKGTAVLSSRLEAEADLGYYKIIGSGDLGSILASLSLNVSF